MRRSSDVVVFLLALPIALFAFIGSAVAGEDTKGGLVRDSVRADVAHTWDEENSAWSTVPSGLANDVIGFRYEPVCFDDRNSGDLAVCVRQPPVPQLRRGVWSGGSMGYVPQTRPRGFDTRIVPPASIQKTLQLFRNASGKPSSQHSRKLPSRREP